MPPSRLVAVLVVLLSAFIRLSSSLQHHGITEEWQWPVATPTKEKSKLREDTGNCITVSESSAIAINGDYTVDGILDGVKSYRLHSEAYTITHRGGSWWIDVNHGGTSYHSVASSASTPPFSGWGNDGARISDAIPPMLRPCDQAHVEELAKAQAEEEATTKAETEAEAKAEQESNLFETAKAYACVAGQTQLGGPYLFETEHNTQAACQTKCSMTVGCVAFDYTTKPKGDACRGVQSAQIPRIADAGWHNRQYCTKASTWTLFAKDRLCSNSNYTKKLSVSETMEKCSSYANADGDCGNYILFNKADLSCVCSLKQKDCDLAPSESGTNVYVNCFMTGIKNKRCLEATVYTQEITEVPRLR